MNSSCLNLSPDELQQLDKLVHGFKKLNGFHKIELYRVTESEVIVGAKKFFSEEPGEQELVKYKREAVAAIKSIYLPFSKGRKVHINIKFYFDSGIGI